MNFTISPQQLENGDVMGRAKALAQTLAIATNGWSYAIRPATPHDATAIAKLSFREFGGGPNILKNVEEAIRIGEIEGYTVIVASDQNQTLAGFAFGIPKDASFGRFDGQVAEIQQVVVAKRHRGIGLGPLILAKAIDENRTLGFSRLVLQFRPGLANWYAGMGWTVLPINQVSAWLEPPLPSTETVAPLAWMDYSPNYPQMAYLDIGCHRPIVHVHIDAVIGHKQTIASAVFAVTDALADSVDLLKSVPLDTLVNLYHDAHASPRFKQWLESLNAEDNLTPSKAAASLLNI